VVQFHPARTYEDFIVGLAPEPTQGGLAFEVRAGDLVRASLAAQRARQEGERWHTLIIDEINRGDLGRVLGEAIYLFEPGELDREVALAHELPALGGRRFGLDPGLLVLGTRNTADRSIARMDLAIRRRFAFLEMWPDLEPVRAQGDELAVACFKDCLETFTEYCDDEALRLVPGHSYFLDLPLERSPKGRRARIAHRLRYELLPLLREYIEGRLVGSGTSQVQGLVDRIESELAAQVEG